MSSSTRIATSAYACHLLGGKCYRETISPFQGKVEKRDEVPCNTTCPPAKG